jgi:hypothetical protein
MASHLLNVREKPAFLHALMRELAENAHISFEGDLSSCRGLFELPGASSLETALRRNTIAPVEEFVVLPLESDTVSWIFQRVQAKRCLVEQIIHIQIEKEGVLQLGSYDNWQCVWTGLAVPEAILRNLRARRILRWYGKDAG